MIMSMTGYGRACLEGETFALTVEIRSVNHRFLKASVRMPEVWEQLGGKIETLLKERVARGAVTVNVRKSGVFAGAREYVVNPEAVEEYRRQFAGIKGGREIALSDILALPGVVGSADESDAELDAVWKTVGPVIVKAADEMVEMRRREGEHLRGVLLGLTTRNRELTQEIRRRAPGMVSAYRDRLTARVRELLRDSDVQTSQTDLARELAVFAERSDIREEIDRMDSHLKQFEGLMNAEESVGRSLEFLVQEMFRETNTMGSKAADVELARLVLDAKAEVDRLKEQIMNVE